MPKILDLDVRRKAKNLYVVAGKTYDEIVKLTGISKSQCLRWSKMDEWITQRKEYQDAVLDIERHQILLTKKMIEEAYDSGDPQKCYAAARLLPHMPGAGSEEEIDHPRIFLENLKFMAETLKEINPEGLKVLSRNFDEIVERYKALHEKKT